MIKGALEADGRLAAKNAVKIRAALRQVADFKRVFSKYQETMPQPTDNPTQDRTRARSWLILNVYLNDEPLRQTVMRAWAEAYVLGQAAADEWIKKTEEANKADGVSTNWDNWKPGDKATALLLNPTKGFEAYLQSTGGASYFKKFNKETIVNLGTALSDSIAAGLDAESAAVMIGRHVASPSRALTIAITEQNRAMSFGSIQRYKEAGLQKMEWAVSDPCDICAKNDGQVIVIGQTFASGDAQPPAHPHCRCVLLPVIPGMEDDDPMGIDGGLAPMPDGAPIVELPTESISDGYRVLNNAEERNEFITYQLQDKKFIELAYEKPGVRGQTEGFYALRDYKSYGYGKVNEYLRTGQVSPLEINYVKQNVAVIDKIMKIAPGLPEPIVTYRLIGQGNLATQIDELFADLSPGDVWIDKGYSSTSLDKNYAETFKNGWIIDIENSQGTKGVMLDGLLGKNNYENKESEWLLPRNTSFEVLETDPTARTMKVRVKQ
jgi:SPP1 gp7 family putative phage head morphogenesis protein